jgi:hypothetical protein
MDRTTKENERHVHERMTLEKGMRLKSVVVLKVSTREKENIRENWRRKTCSRRDIRENEITLT